MFHLLLDSQPPTRFASPLHLGISPNIAIPSSTMSTACSLSPRDPPQDPQDPRSLKAREDRETFSCQTLILTALTAINNGNNHPTLHNEGVNKERIKFMNDKVHHTPVIDAATTILVTDTEILATMTRGTHGIVAIQEIKGENQVEDDRLSALLDSEESGLNTLGPEIPIRVLGKIDALLPDSVDYNTEESGNADDKDVFFSFPNICKSIPVSEGSSPYRIDSSSTSDLDDPICKPIIVDKGLWEQIMDLNSGFILEGPK